MIVRAPSFAAAAVLLAATAALAQTDPPPAKITVTKLQTLTLGLTGYTGEDAARSDAEVIQATLSAKLGRNVTTRVFPNSDALSSALAKGEIDLAWMQPFAVVDASKKGKVTPLVKAVRHGLPFYRGVLFTKGEKTVPILKGATSLRVAWVSKTSAAGYLFPRAFLVQGGLKPAKLFKSETFEGDHGAVCRAVLAGKAEVGATYADDVTSGAPQVDGCVQAVGAEAAKDLHIIATSAPIPNDAIVLRPGLDPAEAERVRKTFVGLAEDTTGKALLASVFKAEGFVEAGADDFEPVKFAAEASAKK